MTENSQGGKGTTSGTSLPLRLNLTGYGTQLCCDYGGRSRIALLADLYFAQTQAVSGHFGHRRNVASADVPPHEIGSPGRPHLCRYPRGLCRCLPGAASGAQPTAHFVGARSAQHRTLCGLRRFCAEKARPLSQLCRDPCRPLGHERVGIHGAPDVSPRDHRGPQRADDAGNESRTP